jgi:hypothetical protein
MQPDDTLKVMTMLAIVTEWLCDTTRPHTLHHQKVMTILIESLAIIIQYPSPVKLQV